MPYLRLKQLAHKELFIATFEKYPELRTAKERAAAKQLGIGYAGKASDIKEFQAARWVDQHANGYRNYNLPITNTSNTQLSALQSLETAIGKIGKHEWVLIWQQ